MEYEMTSYEVLYEDISLLNDIYDLNELNFNIVKEDIRNKHAYRMIGDTQILIEGMGDMLSSMGNFFKTMLEKIKEFFKKFFMFIDSQFMEIDKFVKKYKSDLDKVRNVSFTIQGYNFTIGNKPDITPFKDLVDSYNSALSDVKSLSAKTIAEEENRMLGAANLDKVRGIVLGTNNNISEDNYSETVRKHYRGGEVDTIDIEVNDSLFRQMVSSADSLVKRKKEAERYRDQLIYALEKAERFFSDKVSAIYVNNTKKVDTRKLKLSTEDGNVKLSEDESVYIDNPEKNMRVMDKFVKYKYNYTRALSSIINIATNEYCNAYKDNVKMAREIIVKSLKKENRKDTSKSSSNDD